MRSSFPRKEVLYLQKFLPLPTLLWVFMNNFESSLLISNVQVSRFSYLFRYAYDIFSVLKGERYMVDDFPRNLNAVHPRISFTVKVEEKYIFNFLYLLTLLWETLFQYISKPIHTDNCIDNHSNHPINQ